MPVHGPLHDPDGLRCRLEVQLGHGKLYVRLQGQAVALGVVVEQLQQVVTAAVAPLVHLRCINQC